MLLTLPWILSCSCKFHSFCVWRPICMIPLSVLLVILQVSKFLFLWVNCILWSLPPIGFHNADVPLPPQMFPALSCHVFLLVPRLPLLLVLTLKLLPSWGQPCALFAVGEVVHTTISIICGWWILICASVSESAMSMFSSNITSHVSITSFLSRS